MKGDAARSVMRRLAAQLDGAPPEVSPRTTTLDVARYLEPEDDEAKWDLRKHTTPFYDVFPNTILVFHPHWLSAISLWPVAVDAVTVVHRMLIPPDVDAANAHKLDKSFAHIDETVFEHEDLRIAASIQSTLASGANDRVVLGAQEEGMRLFHAARDRALAEE